MVLPLCSIQSGVGEQVRFRVPPPRFPPWDTGFAFVRVCGQTSFFDMLILPVTARNPFYSNSRSTVGCSFDKYKPCPTARTTASSAPSRTIWATSRTSRTGSPTSGTSSTAHGPGAATTTAHASSSFKHTSTSRKACSSAAPTSTQRSVPTSSRTSTATAPTASSRNSWTSPSPCFAPPATYCRCDLLERWSENAQLWVARDAPAKPDPRAAPQYQLILRNSKAWHRGRQGFRQDAAAVEHAEHCEQDGHWWGHGLHLPQGPGQGVVTGYRRPFRASMEGSSSVTLIVQPPAPSYCRKRESPRLRPRRRARRARLTLSPWPGT